MFKTVTSFFLSYFPNKSVDHIEQIFGGFSNKIFKIKSGLEAYKIRIADHNDLIDRVNEYSILKALNISNCLIYEESSGNSIWNWIEGERALKEQVNKEFIEKIVVLIKDIHETNIQNFCGILEHDDLEFSEKTKKYLDTNDIFVYEKLVDKYKNHNRVLCHNDISLGNIIFNPLDNQLILIDYEWGRINNPYWDYGNFVKEADLSLENIEYLSEIANLDLRVLFDFCFIATIYSLQLSYIFPQTESLNIYRDKLNKQLLEYRKRLSIFL